MDILNVKLKTLLSYIESKYDADVVFKQHNGGYGNIAVVYSEKNQNAIISWVNEEERETKLMEYIFLNRL